MATIYCALDTWYLVIKEEIPSVSAGGHMRQIHSRIELEIGRRKSYECCDQGFILRGRCPGVEVHDHRLQKWHLRAGDLVSSILKTGRKCQNGDEHSLYKAERREQAMQADLISEVEGAHE